MKSSLSFSYYKVIAFVAIVGLFCVAILPSLTHAANPPLTVVFSSSAPTEPADTAQNPIPVTATFSEGVTNFTPSDLSVSNGSVVNFASTSASVYTFGITPQAPSGSVSVDLNSGLVTGDDAQTNQAAQQIQFIYNPNSTNTGTTTPTATSSIAYLALSVYSGAPGTTFNALGSSFDSLEPVSIVFGGMTTTTVADVSGDFSTPITVPSLTTGPATITATGGTSGLVATNSFYVEPATTTATSTASLALSVYSGLPGTTFTALGTNFDPSESVSVAFVGTTTTAIADASGDFSTLLTAPLGTNGPMSITATGETSGFVASNSFDVESASSTSTPGGPSLTITGGPSDGSSTNQQIVTFAFTTDPGATTECVFGSSFACGSPVTLGSTTTPLTDGPYIFSVIATNASSTASTTVTSNFTVDTVAPIVAEVTPVPTPSNNQTPQYTFTSSEAGTLTLGGGCTTTTTAEDGTNTITFQTLTPGTYSCTLTVTDAAGNVSNILPITAFTINAPTPAPSSGGGGGGGVVGDGPLSVGYVNTNPTGIQTTSPAPATIPQGQVLGASAYNFTHTLSLGSTGTDVTQLQMILITDGFLNIQSPTGYFGILTQAAVNAFQKAHGLPQVGVVGPRTRTLLNEGSTGSSTNQTSDPSSYIFNTNLTVGSSGPAVLTLQQTLTEKGFYSGPITGYFGQLTLAAVKGLQASNNLPQTGYVGLLTRGVLNQA